MKRESRTSRPILYMVIPCYNEEEVLPLTSKDFSEEIVRIDSKWSMISGESRILFVNDGSKDEDLGNHKTVGKGVTNILKGLRRAGTGGIKMPFWQGLMEAKDRADITISIDCDGQDDINAMDLMIQEYMEGSEIVYGVRNDRGTDTFFKRTSAEGFYKLLTWMGVETVYNHADYRLVSARVLQEFENFKEVNIFLRGMFPLVGFKSTCVYYKRQETAGGTKPLSFVKNAGTGI